MAVRSPPSVFKEMRLMDATMIDEHLENIDRRLTRIEQILPSLATKAEFQTLATKDALKTLATKEDLKTLATKEELKTLATKEDLKTLATKEELKTLVTKEELKTLATKEELKTLATKEELREEGERSRRHMDVIVESLRADIQLIAEHVVSPRPGPPDPREPR
jgi:hypothetical protein